MTGDGVTCLCCCGIPNGVAHRNEALRTNNGYNATINLVTRDDDADKTVKARAAAGRRWSVGRICRHRWQLRRRRRRQARADAGRQGTRAGATTTARKGVLTAGKGGRRRARDVSRRDDNDGRRGRTLTGKRQEPARRQGREPARRRQHARGR
jgi:hypothetical protein